jgi:uncharacterized membrane protein
LKTRLPFADLLRGLLMVHMALDHASLFWNRDRFADEFWYALPTPVDFPNFIARFTGFPVAPGFSFMAGFMVAITDAGRAARGDAEPAVRRRLLTRAALLIVIELAGFSLAMGHVQVGVLTCLGVCLAITTFVRRAPLRILAPVALAILALHPLLRGLWTDRLDAAGVTIKVLHQAGRFPGLDVYYPLIPWLGVMLLGVAAGRRYLEKGPGDWPLFAAIFFGVFLVVRFLGIGAAGGYERAFSYAFFTWSKYPPDLPWLAASFAALFATLAVLERFQGGRVLKSFPAEFIAAFGRVPLFFYVLHFAILWITAPRDRHQLPAALLAWILVLLLAWWPCVAWREFQARRRNRFQTPGAPV